MFDFGWSEFFLIIVLGIVLIGPKDIPELVYQGGRLLRRLQYMKFALTRQFDDFMEQADLKDIQTGLHSKRILPRDFMAPPVADDTNALETNEQEEDSEFYAEPNLPLDGGGS